MKALWHPLSTILLAEPRCFATRNLLRMLLRSGRRTDVIYAGDRMWPALRQGQRVPVEAVEAAPQHGDVVLACADEIPDLLRVKKIRRDGVLLAADADPQAARAVPHGAILARADLPRRGSSRALARLRRLAIDLREALGGRPDARADPAQTVLEKYDAQAAYYVGLRTADIDAGLLERIAEAIPRERTILVVGSGTGRESFALAAAGWRVIGVEFSPAMCALAREEAARRGLSIEFHAADIRRHELPRGTLDGVLFTYDVYSFLPRRAERIAVLRKLRSWLRPRGRVYLSARRPRSSYDRLVLTLQWLALTREGPAEWGDSHTRWIAADGALHRSFVHVFSDAGLREEIGAADFRLEAWRGGHGALSPLRTAIIGA